MAECIDRYPKRIIDCGQGRRSEYKSGIGADARMARRLRAMRLRQLVVWAGLNSRIQAQRDGERR